MLNSLPRYIIFIILGGILQSGYIFGQKNIFFNCCKECLVDTTDLMIVYDDFTELLDTTQYELLLMEYKKKANIVTVVVLESNDTYELFYRNPDCYFFDKNNIVYIYAETYYETKDSLFLAEVLDNTQKILHYNRIKQNYYLKKTGKSLHFRSVSKDIVWKSDSIKKGNTIINHKKVPLFDPVPIEYQIRNHQIISKTYVERVLFPDISKPKGVGAPLYRMLPYWCCP